MLFIETSVASFPIVLYPMLHFLIKLTKYRARGWYFGQTFVQWVRRRMEEQ